MAIEHQRYGELSIVIFVLFFVVALTRLGEAAFVPLAQGALMSLLVGLGFVFMAMYAILAPRADGLRAVNLIRSEAVGPAESFGARLAGGVLLAIGIAFLALGTSGTIASPVVGVALVLVGIDVAIDPRSIGRGPVVVGHIDDPGPGERLVFRLTAILLILFGAVMVWFWL